MGYVEIQGAEKGFRNLQEMFDEGQRKPYLSTIGEDRDWKHYMLGSSERSEVQHTAAWLEKMLKSNDIDIYTTSGNCGTQWVGVKPKRNGRWTYAFQRLFSLFETIADTDHVVDEMGYYSFVAEAQYKALEAEITNNAESFDNNHLTAAGLAEIAHKLARHNQFEAIEESTGGWALMLYWETQAGAQLRGDAAINYLLQSSGYCWSDLGSSNWWQNQFGSIFYGGIMVAPYEIIWDDDREVLGWCQRTALLLNEGQLQQLAERPWAGMAIAEEALVAHMQASGRVEKWDWIHRLNYHKNREVQ